MLDLIYGHNYMQRLKQNKYSTHQEHKSVTKMDYERGEN